MAANAVVRARIDEDIKNEATLVLEAMGLTVSDALRMMMVRIAKEKTLPFEPLVPNVKTISAMREARDRQLKSFTSTKALMKDLKTKN
jgi:DNA-damage-inducible protein J